MNALSYSRRSTEGSAGSAYSHAYIRPREKKQVKSLSRMATLCVLLLLLAVPAFAAELKTRLPVVIVPGPAEVEQAYYAETETLLSPTG